MVNFNAEKTNKERCNGLRRCACIVAPRRKDDQGTAQQKTSDILKDDEPEGAWLEGLGKESKITCLLCHVRGLHILPTFFVEYKEKTPRAQLVVLVFRSEFLSFAVNCPSESGMAFFINILSCCEALGFSQIKQDHYLRSIAKNTVMPTGKMRTW